MGLLVGSDGFSLSRFSLKFLLLFFFLFFLLLLHVLLQQFHHRLFHILLELVNLVLSDLPNVFFGVVEILLAFTTNMSLVNSSPEFVGN